jgi:hypothetical protein
MIFNINNFRLSCIIILSFILISVSAQTTLDNFNDGNYVSNPVWTVNSGNASAATNALVFGSGATGVSISTPLTIDCQAWSFSLKSSGTFNNDNVRFYFVLINNSSPSNAISDGYCVDYDGNNGDFILYRLDNGTLTSLGSSNQSASSLTRTVTISMNLTGDITVSVSGLGTIITANSTTYPANSSEFISITCNSDDSDAGDTFTIDDITYTEACNNPISGGIIANAQTSCGSFDPTTITSTSLPSGQTGTLEYKWQSSTTNSITGFSDIASSNSTTYDPSTISQTTWYKRIARVSCKTDWIGAVETNVVEITVSSAISLDGTPVSDTVYNELGNASFGVSLVNPASATYQWQVSTNNGLSWSNISNGSFYFGVTDSILQITNPTYAMNNYLYRCVISNTCGSINSGSDAKLNVIQLSTFSNTSSTSCGTNLNNDFSFQRTITVSGLPSTLGTSSGLYVLREVRIKLGNSTCKGDLGTYNARLKSPIGTTINLFNGFTVSSTNMWADIKYRDHVALERVKDYQASVQSGYFPYKIGYYAPETDNTFDDFNGQDPNGNWILELSENTDLTNDGGVDDEVSFERVDLIFGPPFVIIDLTSSTSNNNCSSSSCSSTQEIIIGTNNGYSEIDPNYPSVSGCSWNSANNNSAWFKFTASSSTSRITISGLNGGGSNDQQPIIVKAPTSCSSPSIVPTGGCPDDESINNSSYLIANGGGTTSGNIFSNGITANVEFNLSSLVADDDYYIYIDGNGGTSSSFYIELESGAQTCRTLLPVEFSLFKAIYKFPFANLKWRTESELNNDRFEIEKSTDGVNWKFISSIKGKGTTSAANDYEFTDENIIDRITYYRLKQIDFDGKFSYSSIETVIPSDNSNVLFYPNPATNEIVIANVSDKEFSYQLIDQLGRVVLKGKNRASSNIISIEQLDAGVYVLIVNDTCYGKLIKR